MDNWKFSNKPQHLDLIFLSPDKVGGIDIVFFALSVHLSIHASVSPSGTISQYVPDDYLLIRDDSFLV